MKRAEMLLVSLLLAASTLGATAQAASAYRGDVWSNSDGFSSNCLGFTDTYPQQLYNLANTQLTRLGYSPMRGDLGPAFTTSAFLGNVASPWAVYVHTHAKGHSYAPPPRGHGVHNHLTYVATCREGSEVTEDVNPTPEESLPTPPSVQIIAEVPDSFLQSLVMIANMGYFSIDVTLLVGGAIINGTLTSIESYWDNFNAGVAKATAHFTGDLTPEQKVEAKQGVVDVMKMVTDTMRDLIAKSPDALPQMIHLRDASITTPAQGGSVVVQRGVWWRGRLSHVDGFSVGTAS